MKFIPCPTAWLDGRYVPLSEARVPITSHAIHYGTSVFEGIRAYWNGENLYVFRLEDHVARLIKSANFYLMTVRHTESEIIRALIGLCAKNKLKKSCYIRPFCFVGEAGIQLAITRRAPVYTAMYLFPAGGFYDKNGISIGVSSWRKFSDASTSHMVKAGGNYLNAIVAAQEAHRNGYDEALMLDSRGLVSESPGENIFIVRHGKLTTPTLASSPLEGITRETIIQLASEEGIDAQQTDIARSELYVADEIFLTGTAAEVIPVTSIDGKRIGNGTPGAITKRLMRVYRDTVMAKNARHSDWLTAVY